MVTSAEGSDVVKPSDASSALHPVVMLTVTAATAPEMVMMFPVVYDISYSLVELLHRPCEHRPTSQVLTGSIIEALLLCNAIETIPEGFRHVASGAARTLWKAFLH